MRRAARLMFSLFGLCSLLFFLYLRPQEAITALQALPMLNLCAALGGLGLVIDRLTKYIKPSAPPKPTAPGTAGAPAEQPVFQPGAELVAMVRMARNLRN